MSSWPSTKARRVLAALLKIGWSIKQERGGSHKTLERDGWPNYVFAFHDNEEVGPRMLARIARKTGLTPEERRLIRESVLPTKLRLPGWTWHNEAMADLERIESEIRSLSGGELPRFRVWFEEYDWNAWDRQLENHVTEAGFSG